MKKWLWNVFVSFNQCCNVVFGPLLNLILRPKQARFGDPDETLSSVLGKGVANGDCRLCRPVCRVLNWIDPNHCQLNQESDEGTNAL